MTVITRRDGQAVRATSPAPPSWWRTRGAQGWLYAAPTALIVGVLFLAPLVLIVWMSLNRWPLLGQAHFNAPDNYTKIADNPLFLDAVGFTLKYTVITTVLLSVVALGLALLVQERRPGVGFFRTAFFLPGAVGFASAALLFYGLLNNDFGPIDPILRTLGIIDEPVKWTGTPNMALFSTITLVIWRFAGFNMLILLTGLQAIPVEVYEAARSDGANRLADLHQDHVAAPAAHDRADAHPQHHRLAARLRPVLHLHQRRPGQQHRLHGHGRLPRRVLPLRPRWRGGAVGRAAGRAGGAQRPADARAQEVELRYYTTLSALAVLFLFPLLWSGWSSFDGGPGNYAEMARFGEGLDTYLTNSVLVSVMTVAGTLVVSALGGYAFARFDFPGKNLLFLATLAILMVPYATILIPLYVLLGYIGLQNSLVGLSLVFVMFQLPFALFMMRNAFEAIPRELEEAALVDGCGTFRAFSRILLHAVRPALITVGLFAFLASWNDFFAPLILLNDGARFTLPVAVVSMAQRTFGAIDYGMLQAGVMVMALPCLILFIVLQRHYVRGFMSGALRG